VIHIENYGPVLFDYPKLQGVLHGKTIKTHSLPPFYFLLENHASYPACRGNDSTNCYRRFSFKGLSVVNHNEEFVCGVTVSSTKLEGAWVKVGRSSKEYRKEVNQRKI